MFKNSLDSTSANPYKSSFSRHKFLFIYFAIFILVLAVSFYYVLSSGTRNTLIQALLIRQEAVSKAGSQSISAFIKLFSNSLLILSENQQLLSNSQESQELLEHFIAQWKDTPINGILLANKDGIVSKLANETGGVITGNISVADRDYFIWARQAKKGDIFVGKPIYPKEGLGNLGKQYVVPITTPLFKDGQFNGVLTSSILLSQLTEDYLNPLRASPSTRIYLINQDGIILYAPNEKLIGVNYIQYLSDYPFLGNKITANLLEEHAKSRSAGKLDLVLPDEQKGGLTRFIIAHSPIFYDHQHWVLAIATPADEALKFIAPIYINQLGVLGAGFLALLLLTVAVMDYRERYRHKPKHID